MSVLTVEQVDKLTNPIARQFCFWHYVLGESVFDSALAAHFLKDDDATLDELRYIAEHWNESDDAHD